MSKNRILHAVIAGLGVMGVRMSPAQAQSPIIDNTIIVSSGLQEPVTMAFLGSNDFLVLERSSGRIKRIQFPGPVITTVLQLSVLNGTEEGMLGIAMHPDFDRVGYVYLFYTSAVTRLNEIVRYYWDGTRFISRNAIYTLAARSSTHLGGIIHFGTDRKLYIVTGDQRAIAPTTNSHDSPHREIACILRLNADGSTPEDNPFIAVPGWERIFAYGIRNSYGLTVDPLTGFLWETENGVFQWDEINRVPPGFNGGWSQVAGPYNGKPLGPDVLFIVPGSTYMNPQFSWPFTVVPTAICFLHSPRWPATLRDDCLVGKYAGGTISRFEMTPDRSAFTSSVGSPDKISTDADSAAVERFFQSVPRITDIKLGPDGYLYCVSFISSNIYRIRPRFPMGDINLDQNVTEDDMPLFFDLVLGNSSDPEQITQADFDGDGSVTGLDIQGFVDSLRLPN